MDLNEAIKHFEEKAKELRTEAGQLRDIGEVISRPKQPYNEPVKNCLECAEEYEQLAEWLKELKDYREGLRTCENCRHECKDGDEYPCSICRCNHQNKFEWKDGEQDELHKSTV